MFFYIESLVFYIMIGMVTFWYFIVKLTNKRYVRRYKEENDKGYQGEENRKRLIERGKPDPTEPISINSGSTEPSKQSELQATGVDTDGKTSNSNRKISRKFRNPFRRGGRKK
jgi:hypothetical protein|tara:strand:- start:548 stop:886 length:339 start_codon:yes stop_codon:yes gene_type:complete